MSTKRRVQEQNISTLKSEIDRLVYQLYGLTEDEPMVAVLVGR